MQNIDETCVRFARGLFDSRPLPSNNGYTWTLTSRIGSMLQEAEELFGERDKAWTILGVEICVGGEAPQNWYPGERWRKNIIFQLVSPAEKDIVNAHYQLAHEVVHALSPEIDSVANVLEEGLATWFARYYVREHFKVDVHEGLESYRMARERAECLLAVDRASIKKLRSIEPCFKKMGQVTFEKAGLLFDAELMEKLTAKFVR